SSCPSSRATSQGQNSWLWPYGPPPALRFIESPRQEGNIEPPVAPASSRLLPSGQRRDLRQLAHDARREPPYEFAGRFRREFRKADQAAPGFLESEIGVPARADQARSHLAQVRFVTHHQDAPPLEMPGEEGNHRFG